MGTRRRSERRRNEEKELAKGKSRWGDKRDKSDLRRYFK
jgi:hypothetical protein